MVARPSSRRCVARRLIAWSRRSDARRMPSLRFPALQGQDGAQELGPKDCQALPQEGGGGGWPASSRSSCTRCSATARPTPIGRTPTASPGTRRPPRSASFWASAHDVRGSLQPQTGVRLNAQGDPLRRMRTDADHGKREARHLAVARAILDHARMPVTSPRRSHADMRRAGSTTAQTVPNLPSMTAEDCTVHQASQPKEGSARRLVRRRAASPNSASSDTLANRRRRWPEREKRPRLRRQGKSAAVGRAHVIGEIEECANAANTRCWRFQ
jgi:hypothetical protein